MSVGVSVVPSVKVSELSVLPDVSVSVLPPLLPPVHAPESIPPKLPPLNAPESYPPNEPPDHAPESYPPKEPPSQAPGSYPPNEPSNALMNGTRSMPAINSREMNGNVLVFLIFSLLDFN